jgi:undecaprenyl-diphosphatase
VDAAAARRYTPTMNATDAIVLGVVEGLTEFIPVSSTGHLILTSAWLGHDATAEAKAAADAYDIVIQLGALLACGLYYLPLLRGRFADLRGSHAEKRQRAQRLVLHLGIAFAPVVVVGLLARKAIKAALFGPAPVMWALAVGGVVMIALDQVLRRRPEGQRGADTLDALTPAKALGIGLAQCFALIPGTSRSMATIVGGMFAGLSARAASDFSFLLALPVLGAATVYEGYKEWDALMAGVGLQALGIGMAVSFVVGWLAIAGFLKLIGRVGLTPFGVYRVLLAGAVWLVLLRG